MTHESRGSAPGFGVFEGAMELDLDDDLTSLRSLTAGPIAAGPGELEAELDSRWREQCGVPETGFRVYDGYSMEDMALWRIAFVGKSHIPGWARGRQSRCWVRYKHLECIWRGPRAAATHTRSTKDGTPIEIYCGQIENFQLSLIDALAAMQAAKEKHIAAIVSGNAQLRGSIAQLQRELAANEERLAAHRAFNPESVLPEEELAAEELACEIATLR